MILAAVPAKSLQVGDRLTNQEVIVEVTPPSTKTGNKSRSLVEIVTDKGNTYHLIPVALIGTLVAPQNNED
jgi:hypothetical protein